MRSVFAFLCLVSAVCLIDAAPAVSFDLVPPGLAGSVYQTGVDPPLQHPAVVRNAAAESQLPSELLNPFYKNPAIAEGLAKESWFGDKEFPVHHREAENIDRSQIFKLVNNIRSTR